MLQGLAGFSTIWLVIGAGWLLAHVRVVDDTQRRFFARTAFLIAMPVLLEQMMAKADLARLFSRPLAVSVVAIGLAATTYVLIATFVFHRPTETKVIGALASSYTNVANIGLPIATYVLHDATWIAPVLLVQVGILQPAALVILDSSQNRGVRWIEYVWMPFRNPITVGVMIGVLRSATGLQFPTVLNSALDSIGAMAVPMMLLAFGISLRTEQRPGRGPHAAEMWIVQGIKLILQPLAAFALARWVFGLDPHATLAVTVLGALPAATNIHVMATRYRVAEPLARDSVFISTILCVPTVLIATALLR